jgi:hypothetical protein
MTGTPDPKHVVALLDRLMARTYQRAPEWLAKPELLAQEADVPAHLMKSYTARQLALLTGPDRLPKHLRKRQEEAFLPALLLAYLVYEALREAGLDPEEFS